MRCYDLSIGIEHDEAGACRALVDGADEGRMERRLLFRQHFVALWELPIGYRSADHRWSVEYIQVHVERDDVEAWWGYVS